MDDDDDDEPEANPEDFWAAVLDRVVWIRGLAASASLD